jgi:hypothetical protein
MFGQLFFCLLPFREGGVDKVVYMHTRILCVLLSYRWEILFRRYRWQLIWQIWSYSLDSCVLLLNVGLCRINGDTKQITISCHVKYAECICIAYSLWSYLVEKLRLFCAFDKRLVIHCKIKVWFEFRQWEFVSLSYSKWAGDPTAHVTRPLQGKLACVWSWKYSSTKE